MFNGTINGTNPQKPDFPQNNNPRKHLVPRDHRLVAGIGFEPMTFGL
jgi:hypothetical protein